MQQEGQQKEQEQRRQIENSLFNVVPPSSSASSSLCFCTSHKIIFFTLLSCALVQIVYEMDQTLIASNAKPLSDFFHVTISSIGTLFFVRACVQVLCQPFWGQASDIYNRKYLLLIGTCIWGIVTIVMGFTSSWPLLLVLRGMAGIGLAAILPVIHHLVSDSFVSNKRGVVFGTLGACQMVGGITSIMFATNVSGSSSLFLGMVGWRFTFLCTGLFGILVGIICYLSLSGNQLLRGLGDLASHQQDLVSELTKRQTQKGTQKGKKNNTNTAQDEQDEQDGESGEVSCSRMGKNTVILFSNRTFCLLFVRSAFDGIPMNANSLLILWFEYMGYAENHASSLVAILLLCNGISSLFFGWVGDKAHTYQPGFGRLAIACSALVIQMIFTGILFLDGPLDPGSIGSTAPERDSRLMKQYPIFVAIIVVMGLFGDADQQCCDLPLLADVVPENIRGFAYSLIDMVQCFFAFLATVFVGILAEDTFGFIHSKQRPIKDWDVGTRSVNTKALGNALCVVNLFAMSGSLILYVLMFFTYEKDALNMRRLRNGKRRKRKKSDEEEEDDGGENDGLLG